MHTTQAPILQSTLQLVLLSSISDEELTQTIGVICSSMGGGGRACSTAMNAPNSLPVLHRWCLAACLKFKFMSRRLPRKGCGQGQPASQPASQTDVADGDAAIVPSHWHEVAKVRKDTVKLAYMQMDTLSPENKKKKRKKAQVSADLTWLIAQMILNDSPEYGNISLWKKKQHIETIYPCNTVWEMEAIKTVQHAK